MENFIKGKIIPSFVALLLCSASMPVNAASVLLDFGFNIEGNTSFGPPAPGAVVTRGFDFVTGLGNINFTISGAGSHFIGAFFDHEFTESNTFFNEYGSVSGAPEEGQIWEIDEPGFAFGDIDLNLIAGTLDNANDIPIGLEDDVSMAIGWDFMLAAGDQALITFAITDVVPASGFFLGHHDSDSGESIFLASTLSPISIPATIWLFGSSLLGLVGFSRRNQKRIN